MATARGRSSSGEAGRDARPPRHAGDPRRPGSRRVVRRRLDPDLSELHLRPDRRRRAEGLGLRTGGQPDPRRVRAGARLARGRRAVLRVRQRDGRRDHAAADATPRRPRGARRRRVRRHVSAPHPGAGSVGPRDDDVRPGRRRRARRRDPPDDPLRLGGDPVEPPAEGRRHPGRRRARPRVGLPGRGRQHVRLARAAAAAAARRRRRGPQRDEVRRRSLRPDRRRDRDERGGPDRRGSGSS